MVAAAESATMKAFDHDKPANRAEWVFAFVSAYRKLRPEIGEPYVKIHATMAYTSLKDLTPAKAAQRYFKERQ